VDGITGLKTIVERHAIKAIMHATSCTPEIKEKALSYGAIACVQKSNSDADNLKFTKSLFDLIQESLRKPNSVL
jgi:hypothetical protein